MQPAAMYNPTNCSLPRAATVPKKNKNIINNVNDTIISFINIFLKIMQIMSINLITTAEWFQNYLTPSIKKNKIWKNPQWSQYFVNPKIPSFIYLLNIDLHTSYNYCIQ